MPRPIRVGAVNYLNTKPLIEGLSSFAPHAELHLDLPKVYSDSRFDLYRLSPRS
jgi:chorismate dehydratase